MPKKTIAQAYFVFRTSEGSIKHAVRGETVDVPEGEELERGEKFGAFTAHVGDEPPAPLNTEMPDLEIDWDPEEYNRWIDGAKINEVMDKLGQVAPSQQPDMAQKLIEAEHSRGNTARSTLLEALTRIATGQVTPDDETNELEPSNSDEEDLGEYLASNGVDTIIERAKADPDLIPKLRTAEEAGKNRSTLLEALSKLEA